VSLATSFVFLSPLSQDCARFARFARPGFPTYLAKAKQKNDTWNL